MTGEEARRFRNSRLWKELSRRRLKLHSECVMCKERGIPTKATRTDHIVPLTKGGDPTDDDNLRSLCMPCDIAYSDFGARGRPAPPNRVLPDGMRNPEYTEWLEARRASTE